jgi:glucosyl-dolichyl phosphate glucuronosyltransferase
VQLDVIIPTCDREELLGRALESLMRAPVPPSLDVRITVVDNNSKDGTRALVTKLSRCDGRLRYIFEPRQGRSPALNAGISQSRGDLIGMIDDDEEIDAGWYRCVARLFADPTIDFIGGPYVPRWGAPQVPWLPTAYRGVIGWVDAGPERRAYGPGFAGMLMGGNAVIRRPLLHSVGPYDANLGRTRKGLMSCEDEDMFQRLLAAGARGVYVPDLIIHHYVPPERLTKRYFRSWCFWRGVSRGVLDRDRPQAVRYAIGVPRYLIGSAVRSIPGTILGLFKRSDPNAFAAELALWDLAGFMYGRYRRTADPDGVTPVVVERLQPLGPEARK